MNAFIDIIQSNFRYKNAELHGKLKRAFEEIDNLTKQNNILTGAVREAKTMLKRKTDLCLQVPSTIKVDLQTDFSNMRTILTCKFTSWLNNE